MQSSSLDDNYWVLAVIAFLFILCKIKYQNIECLRESIKEYLSQICPQEVIEEEEEILELEELTDMITSFKVEVKK